MIRSRQFLENWEKKHMRKEATHFSRNLHIFECLYEEARELCVLPTEDVLEGLESKVRLARRLNVSGAP